MSKFADFIQRRPVVASLVGSVLLVAGVGAASAQYGWGGHGGWRGQHGGPAPHRMERMCTMESGRWAPVMRAWVKADLNLTPAQAAEFDKLADVAQPAAEQIRNDVCGAFGPAAPRVSPPERLEKAAQTMRKASEALDKAVAPAKAFYATLDERQKARVEQLLDRRRQGRWGGHGGWRGPMGDGPMMGPGPQGMPPAPPMAPRQ